MVTKKISYICHGCQPPAIILHMTTRTLVLQADTHFRLPLPGRWRVSCVQGLVWITASGDLKDHVLQGSDSQVFSTDGSLLIGSLQASRLRLEWLGPVALQQLSGWRARFLLLMQRCWRRPATHFYTDGRAREPLGYHKENKRVERDVCTVLCEKTD